MFDSWKTHSQGAAGLSKGRYLVAVSGALALAALAALTAIAVLAPSAQAVEPESDGPDVDPVLVTDEETGEPIKNPTCEDAGFDGFEFKVDPPNNGTYDVYGDPAETVTIDSDGTYLHWLSTFGIDAVIVKGGTPGNAYVYDPPGPEQQEDDGLHSPENASGGPAGISHISFCYDIDLEVSKTANTTFTRDYDWDIDKECDESELLLPEGTSYNVTCRATVSLLGDPTDSDWAVSGTIDVTNPAPEVQDPEGDPSANDAVVDITDKITPGDIAATVDCEGESDPNDITLAPGETVQCTYSADLPDGSNRTNTAYATPNEPDPKFDEGSGTAAVTFGDPTTETDDCVDVTDDKVEGGELGTVCVDDLDTTTGKYTLADYTYTVGPYEECGEHESTNTASFTTNTPGEPDDVNDDTGSASHTVTVTVVGCGGDGGCTLTPGYWKTHSDQGPAPYDTAWAALGDADADGSSEEEGETFFKSYKSYYQVLWTAPQGNAYYILAHAYIAAKLNILNGAATTPAVAAAISAAESFFASKKPSDSLTKAQRAAVIANAMTLDQYNNGIIGPGHCDENTPA